MDADFLWFSLRSPFATAVLEIADQFLLLCVHRDGRLPFGQRLGYVLVDISELRIAIRMAVALAGLAVGLQTEFLLLQQLPDNRVADPVATVHQFGRQAAQALAGPT